MPTFDGKFEKFELFEDLFQTRLKIHKQLAEDDKINYLLLLMKEDALELFKNINNPTQKKMGELLTILPQEIRQVSINGWGITKFPETRL